jgi:hypothetical protein
MAASCAHSPHVPEKVAFYDPFISEQPVCQRGSKTKWLTRINSAPAGTELLSWGTVRILIIHSECMYIDELATVFALVDVRRSGYPVMVHCDAVGQRKYHHPIYLTVFFVEI